jgi:type IV pilus assembly protein PilA
MPKGFSLIELMVALATIGVLAAVAIPSYQDYVARSQVAEAVMLLGSAKAPFTEYYANHSTWPANTASVMGNTTGRYTSSLEILGTPVDAPPGEITLVATMMFFGIAPGITGGTLLHETSDGGALWTCRAGGARPIEAKHLPGACR